MSGSPTEKAVLQWGLDVTSFNIVLLYFGISCLMKCTGGKCSFLLVYDFSFKIFQLGMNFDLVRSNSSIIHAFPFNSEKKRGGVALKLV